MSCTVECRLLNMFSPLFILAFSEWWFSASVWIIDMHILVSSLLSCVVTGYTFMSFCLCKFYLSEWVFLLFYFDVHTCSLGWSSLETSLSVMVLNAIHAILLVWSLLPSRLCGHSCGISVSVWTFLPPSSVCCVYMLQCLCGNSFCFTSLLWPSHKPSWVGIPNCLFMDIPAS